ncbi:hypothetical protein [Rhizobium phage RHph_X2_28B]|uniref:hypothetical protein n=1 Tax=Rhizobium phage RHph_X2_28B TaxID=2836086 RepID=UPI00232970C3|nr:hypothetical protein PP751_gp006 [Rhizobium phage RHph_X2_28B]QWY83458.1 hypothetical protein [Rhizobium phage RHph_X2_28B]QWY83694.1 hypothetical protein [Rhizobium phage RHph_X3_15]
MTDQEIADAMDLCKAIGVTVHIRGTDDQPLVLFKDKRTRKSLNGLEIIKRLKRI